MHKKQAGGVCQVRYRLFGCKRPALIWVWFEKGLWTDQRGAWPFFEVALSRVWQIEDRHTPLSHTASLP